MGKNTTILLLALIAAFAIMAGTLVFQNRQLIQKLSPSAPNKVLQPAAANASATPNSNQNPKQTLADIKVEIAANINASNFSALENYMATPTVEVVIQSSECCQPQTPTEAAKQAEYILKGLPMEFDQADPQIAGLKSKYPQLRGNYIGLSKYKEDLIAFTFDKNNKVTKITMAASWKIFDFNEPQP